MTKMVKLLSQKTAIALLPRHGWIQTIGGKHNVKMTKAGQGSITLPKHRGQDHSKGLSQSIMKQAGIKQ